MCGKKKEEQSKGSWGEVGMKGGVGRWMCGCVNCEGCVRGGEEKSPPSKAR